MGMAKSKSNKSIASDSTKPPSISSQGNGYDVTTHNFSVLIVRNKEGKYAGVDERKNRGWWLPAGYVDPGDSFYEAGVRETEEEAGLNVYIKGFLRFEHSPRFRFLGKNKTGQLQAIAKGHGRMRAIFYGEPIDPNEKIKTWAEKDGESNGAMWFSVEEFTNIEQTIKEKRKGLKNKVEQLKNDSQSQDNDGNTIETIESEIAHLKEPGCRKIRGNELKHWGRYIDSECPIFGNSVFECYDGLCNDFFGNNGQDSKESKDENKDEKEKEQQQEKDSNDKNDNNSNNNNNEVKSEEKQDETRNNNNSKNSKNNSNPLKAKFLKYYRLPDGKYDRNVGCQIYYFMNIIIKNKKNEYLLVDNRNNSNNNNNNNNNNSGNISMIESPILLNKIFNYDSMNDISNARYIVSQTVQWDFIETENDIEQVFLQTRSFGTVTWSYKNISSCLANEIASNNNYFSGLISIKGILQIQHYEMNGIAGVMNVVWYGEWIGSDKSISYNDDKLKWFDSKSIDNNSDKLFDCETLRWINYLEKENGFIYPTNIITEEGEKVRPDKKDIFNHIKNIKYHRLNREKLSQYGIKCFKNKKNEK